MHFPIIELLNSSTIFLQVDKELVHKLISILFLCTNEEGGEGRGAHRSEHKSLYFPIARSWFDRMNFNPTNRFPGFGIRVHGAECLPEAADGKLQRSVAMHGYGLDAGTGLSVNHNQFVWLFDSGCSARQIVAMLDLVFIATNWMSVPTRRCKLVASLW